MDDTSVVAVPTLPAYSETVQTLAATEMDTLPQACDRERVLDQCSALALFILDYAWLRARVRALHGMK